MTDDSRTLVLIARWEAARDSGEPITPEALCADCPDLLPELKSALVRLHGSNAVSSDSPPDKFDTITVEFAAMPSERPGVGFKVGQNVAGFRLLRKIGEGGFGQVFEAEDPVLNRSVAVKFLLPQAHARPGVREQFLAEARSMAAIQHDHVVPIFQVGQVDSNLFLIMPLLVGETLAQRLKREGSLPPAEVRRIGRELCLGLAALHAKGLIHRDIKPANLWLEMTTGRLKVLDLGLADEAANLRASSSGGTPAYMSPEQVDGHDLDFRSDLFSVGAVLYECVTGRRAFSGNKMAEVLDAVLKSHFVPVQEVNPGVPPDLADLIHSLLQKERTARPASALAVSELLQSTATSTAPASSTPRRVPISAVAATFAGLLLCLAIWFAFVRFNWPVTDAGDNSTNATDPTGDSDNAAANPIPTASAGLLPGAKFTHFMNNSSPRASGRLFENGPVREDDDLRIELQFEEPVYCFLFALNPDGAVQLCYPHPDPETYDESLDEVQADAITELKYPANENEGFAFTDGAGQQAFVLVSSKKPLPSFRDWSASASNLIDALQTSGHWVFADGTVSSMVKSDGTRGGPRKLRGSEPFEKVMNAIQASSEDCDVSGLSFPVEPKIKERD